MECFHEEEFGAGLFQLVCILSVSTQGPHLGALCWLLASLALHQSHACKISMTRKVAALLVLRSPTALLSCMCTYRDPYTPWLVTSRHVHSCPGTLALHTHRNVTRILLGWPHLAPLRKLVRVPWFDGCTSKRAPYLTGCLGCHTPATQSCAS